METQLPQAAPLKWGVTKDAKPSTGLKKLYIREWMKLAGVTVGQLAKAAEVTPGHMSNIIAGRRPNMGRRVLEAIAERLGITVDDLSLPPPTGAVIAGLSPQARALIVRGPKGKNS